MTLTVPNRPLVTEVPAARLAPARHDLVRAFPRMAGTMVLGLSAIVLTGWALHVRVMQSVVPGLVTMKANTAIGLAAGAIALLLTDPRTPRFPWSRAALAALAAFLIALGLATMSQYVFGMELGIDQLVFSAGPEVALTRTPGRMAFVTALAFAVLGVGMAPVGGRWHRLLCQPAVIVVAALGLTSLLGYVYGVIPPTGIGQGLQIAMHTAVAFVLLAFGVLACCASEGWMQTLLSDEAGGVLARRLLPVAFIVPLALGSLGQLGTRLPVARFLSSNAALAVLTMLSFAAIIWRTARALNRLDTERSDMEQGRLQLAVREGSARERLAAERAARVVAESAREAAEQAIREREDAFMILDRVMESTPIGIAVVDSQLRYLHLNSALAALTGLPAEVHRGRSVHEVLTEISADIAAGLQAVIDTGDSILDRDRVTSDAARPGRQRHWRLSFFPLRSAGGVLLGAGVSVQETTAQFYLEEQLRQGQKMEAVGRLAGGVAHDFNNLLTVITGYSGMLLEELKNDEAIRADVAQISGAAARAAGLTRQLLAFSRQQVLEPRVLDLNALTLEMETMLRRLLRTDIALVTRLQPGLDQVLADAGQMGQVLMNLVVNAMDAMPERGQITVETANRELGITGAPDGSGIPPGGYVVLSVTDTGHGMDAATQAQIFEPFFTTKPQGQGTGLGLATVYGIVTQSGGHVTVQSEPGRGTTFSVYLARVDAPGPGPDPSPEPRAAVASVSEVILLAEDEEPVRRVAARVLVRAGYTVLSASTAVEALELARRPGVAVDMLLTDVVMPELNGAELSARFREIHPAAAVVFMSGYAESSVVRGLLQTTGSFVQKPFTPSALLDKVREALDAGRARGPSA